MQRTSIGWALAAALLGVPLAEIALFILVGGAIGLWPTIALVIATAVAGTVLIRMQGFAVLEQARAKLDRGEPPVVDMFHALGLVIGGILLLVPGFLTDALGFLLLVPAVRTAIGRLLWRRLRPDRGSRQGEGVIEGEFTRVDPEAAPETDRLPPDRGRHGADRDSPWGRP